MGRLRGAAFRAVMGVHSVDACCQSRGRVQSLNEDASAETRIGGCGRHHF